VEEDYPMWHLYLFYVLLQAHPYALLYSGLFVGVIGRPDDFTSFVVAVPVAQYLCLGIGEGAIQVFFHQYCKLIEIHMYIRTREQAPTLSRV
jgi:hypothetical protein